MPQGTCEICQCTEGFACEGGCHWEDAEQTICSQCTGWALLREKHPFKGVFPFNLVPIHDKQPRSYPGAMGRPMQKGLRVDMRRLDRETIIRLAYFAAPDNEGTVDEFLAMVDREQAGFMIPTGAVSHIYVARNLENAVELIDGVREGVCVSVATGGKS